MNDTLCRPQQHVDAPPLMARISLPRTRPAVAGAPQMAYGCPDCGHLDGCGCDCCPYPLPAVTR